MNQINIKAKKNKKKHCVSTTSCRDMKSLKHYWNRKLKIRLALNVGWDLEVVELFPWRYLNWFLIVIPTWMVFNSTVSPDINPTGKNQLMNIRHNLLILGYVKAQFLISRNGFSLSSTRLKIATVYHPSPIYSASYSYISRRKL